MYLSLYQSVRVLSLCVSDCVWLRVSVCVYACTPLYMPLCPPPPPCSQKAIVSEEGEWCEMTLDAALGTRLDYGKPSAFIE